MIGAISHTIFIAYASPNSKTLAFSQRLIAAGKSVVTFDSSSNPLLQEQGVVGWGMDEIVQSCLDTQISHPQKLQALTMRDNLYSALHWVSVGEASLQENHGTTTRGTRSPLRLPAGSKDYLRRVS
jgi:hypothetical protein